MWRRFLQENRWYIIALSVSLAVMLMTLYIYTGNRASDTVRSQNAARATSLSSTLHSLPKVSSIVPAKTSGELDYVATSRSTLNDQLTVQFAPRNALWIYGLLPQFYGAGSQQARHSELVGNVSDTLKNTTNDLTHLKKIIEYMPLVDLGGPFGDDPGLGERLERTKKGLDEATEYINWSGLEHSNEAAARLTKLNNQTLALTDQSKAAWASELLEIQKLLLTDIVSQDVQQKTYVDQLQVLSQSYLSDE